MFFNDVYKPIPNVYNLVLAMLWRHPENVKLGKVKAVHYCAAVSDGCQSIFVQTTMNLSPSFLNSYDYDRCFHSML
jgi:hypothetical protein